MGPIDSESCRLPCEPDVATAIGGYVVVLSFLFPPRRPFLLIVLVLRLRPDCPPSPSNCSCCCFFFLQRKKRTPPIIARRAITPPTTPPTMAPMLVPELLPLVLESLEDDADVRTTVRVTMTPLSVTTVALVLGFSVVADWAEELGARFVDDGCVLCQVSQHCARRPM